MFFVIDSRGTQTLRRRPEIWTHLWKMRDFMPVSVVIPTVVSSPCPLLAEEGADTVLTATGIQVPRDSAWVPMQIDLSAFANDKGDIHLGALEAALHDCVNRGDRLHDAHAWPSPAIQFDSWLNRRLAVTIRGWGDLVRRWNADPAAFQTLNELEDIASFIADSMSARSRALARKSGYCPAVDLEGASVRNSNIEMQQRWQKAVDDTALRHRNLIAMSVWDVFPQGRPADLRYCDLLPIVRCADCLSFRRDVDIEHWNINEFRRFYERVSAILQRNIEAGRIAKQV